MPYDPCPTQPYQPALADMGHVPLESARLPMRSESVRVARRRVRETLELFDADPDAIDDAELLASELVTNGVVHAGESGPALRLSLIRDGKRLIVEVHDPSRRMPYLFAEQDDLSESGRGLMIVDKVAGDQGVRPAPDGGKVVWFELIAWPRS